MAAIVAALSNILAVSPALAQDTASDTVAAAKELYGPPPPMEDCSAEQEASILSGEIIVCRRKADQSQYRVSSDGDAEARYAEETMNKDDPRAPDLFGIPDTGVVVARGCFIPPCPPPPALIIDLKAIPEAPPGSDADRIAHGLAPLGDQAANRGQSLATEATSDSEDEEPASAD